MVQNQIESVGMLQLTIAELQVVSGGDAGATRQPGQNSWGEWGDDPIGDIIRATAR